MRGALIVDVGAKDLEAARAVLARAVASGAFGRWRVAIELTSDGRAVWTVSLARDELQRAAEAVLVATAVGASAALGGDAPLWIALPVGAAAGGVYAAVRLARDRLRVRRQVRALVASLPAQLTASAAVVDPRRE